MVYVLTLILVCCCSCPAKLLYEASCVLFPFAMLSVWGVCVLQWVWGCMDVVTFWHICFYLLSLLIYLTFDRCGLMIVFRVCWQVIFMVFDIADLVEHSLLRELNDNS